MSNGGVNVLFDALDNEGIFALDTYVAQTPDDPIMITAGGRHNEGIAKARQIKKDYPTKTVFYRRYPDDYQYQRIPNPDVWLSLYAPLSEGDIYVCDMNESGIGNLPTQAEWMATNIDNLCKRGGHIAFWHINTHNPPRHLLPLLRPAFEAAAAHPGQVKACQHHYFDLWNDDAYRYLVEAQDYCASIGISLEWAITELGYAHGISPYIGFQHPLARDAGLTDEVYGELLVKKLKRLAERRAIAFVYSFGATTPWEPFDIHRSLVLPRLISYRTGLPPMTAINWQPRRATPNGDYPVIVRTSANGADTGKRIPKGGADMLLDGSTATATWYHIRYGTTEGYVSASVIRMEAVVVPEPPIEPHPPFYVPPMEWDPENRVSRTALAAWFRAMANLIEFGVVEVNKVA